MTEIKEEVNDTGAERRTHDTASASSMCSLDDVGKGGSCLAVEASGNG